MNDGRADAYLASAVRSARWPAVSWAAPGRCGRTHDERFTGRRFSRGAEVDLDPDKVESRLGTLEFNDGAPSAATAALLYDHLDFVHGVAAFIRAYPGCVAGGDQAGFLSIGVQDNPVPLFSEEKATEYMKADAIGVLATDKDGKVKEHKLGSEPGKKGMGIGVALGMKAAIPAGGPSLVAGAAGSGVIGEFFHKGLKMTGEDVARTGRELDAGHAAVGVLTWDFETQAVTGKLKELGGTPQAHEVAQATAQDQQRAATARP